MLFLSSNNNIILNNSKKLLNKLAYNAGYSPAIASKYLHCISISNNENLLKCSKSAYGTLSKPAKNLDKITMPNAQNHHSQPKKAFSETEK